jgi:hypothetical protein
MASRRSGNHQRPWHRGGSEGFSGSTLDKGASQEIHALRAAKKRYGVDVGLLGMCDIRAQIQEGRSRCLERQSNRVVIHEVQWAGRAMVVAYDSQRHTLVTFLPPDFEPGVRPWR